MKFAPSLAALVRGAALLNTLCAADQHPSHTVTYFENLPQRVYYFDDTTTVLYHDYLAGNVYISENEGKSWDLVKDVPKAAADQLVEHPFNNRYAFILTSGTTHYRTEDRGQTWHSFEVPIPPLMNSPLSFHADPKKVGYILYQATTCRSFGIFFRNCHDETWYSKEAFGDTPKKMLDQTSKCVFAHSSKDFKHDAPSDLVFCLAWDAKSKDGSHSIESSRLLASTDYFGEDRQIIDFGIGTRLSRGVVALGVVSKFMVAALRDLSSGNNGEMVLYVSVDAKTWAKAHFPHGSSSKLVQNSYTIVESTTHSLAIDVQSHASRGIGTLFVSNSNGTFFVESLKDTHRSDVGYVDFEELVGIDGVGLANYVANARNIDGGTPANMKLKSVITYDDGSSWEPIHPPEKDMHGQSFKCSKSTDNQCSLHLHSVSTPHNLGRVFSSTAPGFVMGVGSVSENLFDYDNSDLFLSTDAGRSWSHVHHGAHKYEFGDQGNVMVIVNDEETTDVIRYSIDAGKTWRKYNLSVKLRARLLTTIPDSTSQKFVLLGSLSRKDTTPEGKHVIVFLDFANMRDRQCDEGDFEKWYARGKGGHECIMGHKQWFNRRKQDADCFVGNKFRDPVVHEENCPCKKFDYECDFNYIREGDECVPVGPEPIPAGVCENERKEEKYKGSSGYRLVPGNTCEKEGGVVMDEPVEKPCSQAELPEGEVAHQTFKFDSPVTAINYFQKSSNVLVQLWNGEIWQSRNEGYTWKKIEFTESFTTYYMHSHSNDRAFLITKGREVLYTTDGARSWNTFKAPLPPNNLDITLMSFHPQWSDWLIWVGQADCSEFNANEKCRTEAWYTPNNGRDWYPIEKYVRQCVWARDNELKIDAKLILCESYRDKQGNQAAFGLTNPLELVIGGNFFDKGERMRLFEQIVGFATFSEYLLVAEVPLGSSFLDLQVSLNGNSFAKGLFPPNMRLANKAYTILESSTDAVFLHVTMSTEDSAEWGNLLKSNSNGTYYGLSLDHVNRNKRGYVDFEKMIGIDGVAVVNIVTNTEEAARSGKKKLQTRISHNDGGTWRSINPPMKDSNGNKYDCSSAKCALHIHGYTERRDPRATYSSPSVVGLMLGVGNVGESLAPYKDSDTFLTRDAGFTWEEVHKDAHMWEFGDSGSVIVIVNDEEPVDHVQYTLDEGMTWREYKFGERLRITNLMTVPEDTSRKFLLIGYPPREQDKAHVVFLDFSSVNKRPCVDKPSQGDFELWSPSEEREEQCLFGRQTLYRRRTRNAKCYIGALDHPPPHVEKNCTCIDVDFECEYNHIRNSAGECVLVSGAQPLPDDDSCPEDAEFWYERTAYRKIPKSSCKGGERPDRGTRHICPGLKAHSAGFWLTIFFIPFGFTALIAFWYYRRSGYQRGTIRLSDRYAFSDSGPLSTLLSIPWFIVGVAGVAWSYVEQVPFIPRSLFRSRRGYRHVPVDEDAQVLRFDDED